MTDGAGQLGCLVVGSEGEKMRIEGEKDRAERSGESGGTGTLGLHGDPEARPCLGSLAVAEKRRETAQTTQHNSIDYRQPMNDRNGNTRTHSPKPEQGCGSPQLLPTQLPEWKKTRDTRKNTAPASEGTTSFELGRCRDRADETVQKEAYPPSFGRRWRAFALYSLCWSMVTFDCSGFLLCQLGERWKQAGKRARFMARFQPYAGFNDCISSSLFNLECTQRTTHIAAHRIKLDATCSVKRQKLERQDKIQFHAAADVADYRLTKFFWSYDLSLILSERHIRG